MDNHGFPAVKWADVLSDLPRKEDTQARILLLFSLMTFLRISLRDILLFAFSTDMIGVRQRAGTALTSSKKDDTAPVPVQLLDLWMARFPKCRGSLLKAMADYVKKALIEEGDKALQLKSLSVKVSKCTVARLYEDVVPSALFSVLSTTMPLTTTLLLAAISAPNRYRKERAQREAKEAEAHERAEEAAAAAEMDGSDDGGAGEGYAVAEDVNDPSAADGTDEGDGLQDDYGMSRSPETIAMVIMMMMLYTRNRATNAWAIVFGMFLKTNGCSVRVINALHRLGLVLSNRSLDRLRKIVSDDAEEVAVDFMHNSGRMFAIIYDNVNLFIRRSQQRLTNLNTMIHATNAAIIGLPAAITESAFDLAARLRMRGGRARATAPTIKPSREQDSHMLAAFKAHVMLLLLDYCPGADKWKDRADMRQKARDAIPAMRPIKPEKTKVFAFGAFDVNEGTLDGAIKMQEQLRERARFSESAWTRILRLILGDLLTSKLLRRAKFLRQDDSGDMNCLQWAQELSQLFHFALNAVHMIIRIHLSNATTDPTGLAKQKKLLKRVWDVNKPDYANGKALIRHSLVARLLDITRLLLGLKSYHELKAWRPSYERLEDMADRIVKTYATSAAADQAMAMGDDWLYHSILFIRDALWFVEFEAAVSYADPGRVLEVIRYWASAFRGAGLHNYARECLEVLVLFEYELPPQLREAMEHAWFVNRWGQPGRFIASDLYLEQLNFWLKRVFISDGSGVTVKNIIEKGSKCIEVMRELSYRVTALLEARDLRRRHKESKVAIDISRLAVFMQSEEVHRMGKQTFVPGKPKRAKKNQETEIPSAIEDAMVKGWEKLNTDKWDEFLKTTTWDPALGYPMEVFKEASNVPAFDTADVFEEVDGPLGLPEEDDLDDGGLDAREGMGGIGGGADL